YRTILRPKVSSAIGVPHERLRAFSRGWKRGASSPGLPALILCATALNSGSQLQRRLDRKMVRCRRGERAAVNGGGVAGPVVRMDDPVERGERAAAGEAVADRGRGPSIGELAQHAVGAAPLVEVA